MPGPLTDEEITRLKPWHELTTDREKNAQLHFLATGDDGTANTEEQIKEAVIQWYERENFSQSDLLEMMHGSSSNSWATSLRIWHNREGKSWQADIEANVAAWRAEPPDYLHDANLIFDVLLPVCRKSGVGLLFDAWSSNWHWAVAGKIDGSAEGVSLEGSDPRRVLCEAIYEALRQTNAK